MPPRLLMRALLVPVLLMSWGCVSVHQAFPGRDPSHVWTALVRVAENPDYTDLPPSRRWSVLDNQVWIDPRTPRIEVFRDVERHVATPGRSTVREEREFRFLITLGTSLKGEPEAQFLSRGFAFPSEIQREAYHYYRSVLDLLGTGSPSPEDPLPSIPGGPVLLAPPGGDAPAVPDDTVPPPG